jgi:hypothetical protein
MDVVHAPLRDCYSRMKFMRSDVQGKREVMNPQIWEVRLKPTSKTPPIAIYKCIPKPPTKPKTNSQSHTVAKPRRMLKEEMWLDDNYHDFCKKDAAFPLKGILPASSMPHHAMLLDLGPTQDVNDLRRLEFKIAEKELQVLNKRWALQLSHKGIEVQPTAISSADLVEGL